MLRCAVALSLCAALLGAVGGCRSKTATNIGGGPIIKERRLAASPDALRKVAVIPLYPDESLGRAQPSGPSAQPAPGAWETAQDRAESLGRAQPSGSSAPQGPARWEIAALVSNFVSEALAAQGFSVVGPSDVELAFTGEGHAVPRLDPVAAAALSARSFAASGVVLGRVMRYREREGGSAGATRPASVAFEISLHEAPSGRRLWVGRFDETQRSLTGNVFRARQYPHGGTRWLSAAELARWGAGEAVSAMSAPQAP